MYIPEKGVLKDSDTYFHTPSSTAKTSFFYLKCAGEFFCDGNYRVERERYNSYLIMYIRKGNGFVSTNSRNIQVGAGDTVLLNCYQPHLYYTSSGWETLWVHFDGNASKDFFELMADHSVAITASDYSPVVSRYLEMIVEGFKRSKPLPEVLVSSHIHRILAEMLLQSQNKADSGMDRVTPVMDAMNYIHMNFGEKITVERLAEHVNVSPYHFSRVFKKETGYSPYEYIIKTRIDHAKVLLKQTGFIVKEVAYRVGFNSESNFVNTFHESVGLTPNEFRHTPV